MAKLKLNKRETAYVQRLKHFDGGACKDCGSTKRYSANGNCVSCALKDDRDRRVKLRKLRDATKVAP
jgi:hypothetical protein